MDHASRVASYILAGPAVWGGLGWFVDRWLGTDPWLMSAGIMAGFAGGLYLVWFHTNPRRETRDPDPGNARRDTED